MESTCEALEGVDVERRAQGQVHLVGPGLHEAADAIDHLGIGAGEHPGPDEVGHAPELLPEALLGPGQTHVDRGAQLGGVAADVVAVGEEHLPLVRERGLVDEGDVDGVGPARGDPQGAALALASYPDGQLGLHRLGLAPRLVQLEVGALEGRDLVPQQAAHALDALLEHVHPHLHRWERDAVGLVLDLAPARAEPEIGPAARELVDGADGVGEDRRVAVADGVHEGAASHRAGVAGQRGVRGHGLQALGVVAGVGGVEVVPDRDPAEAEVLDPPPKGAQRRRVGELQAGVDPEHGGGAATVARFGHGWRL